MQGRLLMVTVAVVLGDENRCMLPSSVKVLKLICAGDGIFYARLLIE